jgi:hypothetical protein
MRTGGVNTPKRNNKIETEEDGDIRDERDPKPKAASEDVEEAEEPEDKKGNLPPAMPPGA